MTPTRVSRVSSRIAESPLWPALDSFALRLNSRRLWLVSAYSLILFGYTLPSAAVRPFWYDEIFTHTIVKLPSFQDSLAALGRGWDLQPPLYFAIVRASAALFGAEELGLRLPSILGFWMGSAALYFLACRLVPPLFAALVLPLAAATPLSNYALEARPYSLVFAFGALALLCWHSTTRGGHERLAKAGLVLSLVAVSTVHYYGFLTFLIIAGGEAAYTFRLRQYRISVWLLIVLSAVPFLLHWPLMWAGIQLFSTGSWNSPNPKVLVRSYSIDIAFLVLAPAALHKFFQLRPTQRPFGPVLDRPAFDIPAVSACLTALAIPVIALFAAYGVSGMVSPRYTLNWLIGAILLASMLAAEILGYRARIGLLLLVMFELIAVVFGLLDLQQGRRSRDGMTTRVQALSLASKPWPGLKIASDDPFYVVPLMHYAPPHLQSVLVDIVDPARRSPRTPEHTIDNGLLLLRGRGFPVPALSAVELLQQQRQFLLLNSSRGRSPLRSHLAERQSNNRFLRDVGGVQLYLVEVSR